MRGWGVIPVLLLAWAALTIGGCTRETPLSHDRNVAIRQVNELLPRGASESRVRKALSDRGFQLSRLNPNVAGDHLLIATLTKGDTTWQVGVIIANAKVAATTVTILDAKAPPK